MHAIDMDPVFIADVTDRATADWPLQAAVHDILDGPYRGPYDAAYSLDVLEHISVEQEARFVGNIQASLSPHGVLIVGMPSLASQAYASPQSKAGHVNCKHAPELKTLMERFILTSSSSP